MKLADFIIIGILALIIVLALAYIRRAKKSGKKCIGCPDAGACCSKKCSCCQDGDDKK